MGRDNIHGGQGRHAVRRLGTAVAITMMCIALPTEAAWSAGTGVTFLTKQVTITGNQSVAVRVFNGNPSRRATIAVEAPDISPKVLRIRPSKRKCVGPSRVAEFTLARIDGQAKSAIPARSLPTAQTGPSHVHLSR
jgi:hypothetical protein